MANALYIISQWRNIGNTMTQSSIAPSFDRNEIKAIVMTSSRNGALAMRNEVMSPTLMSTYVAREIPKHLRGVMK